MLLLSTLSAINTKRGSSKCVGPNIAQNRHRQTVRQQTPFLVLVWSFQIWNSNILRIKLKRWKHIMVLLRI